MPEQVAVTSAIKEARILNETVVEELEECVKAQVRDDYFNLEANLALLKLYLFHPTLSKPEVIASVLQKALGELPNTALVLCLDLVPERHQRRPDIDALLNLHDQLEECRFQEFWANPRLATLPVMPGWEGRVRAFIYDVLAISHQRSDLETTQESLNLSGAELEQYLQEQGCTVKHDDQFPVHFPLGDHNQKRPGAVQASVQVEQVARIL